MIDVPNEKEHRQLIDTVRGLQTPTVLIPDVRLLNTYSGRVSRANIWISGKYIAYVGPDQPTAADKICKLNPGQIVVPAYIEPHSHPFQLYNPYSLGTFLTRAGTMISVNDNGPFAQYLSPETQSAMTRALDQTSAHDWLWWSYFEEGMPRDNKAFAAWLENAVVVQGGELSHWLPFKKGSNDLTEKLYLVRHRLARMEGHLPGASANTLNLFAAAGISADHESMTADDVIHRLELGYYTALRYSSIRRDLPDILSALADNRSLDWSKLMLTNDGATLPFLQEATHAQMIQLAISCGVPVAVAYRMATVNPAVYYHLDHLAGVIAPGRLAHLNILDSLEEPQPVRTLFAGRWTDEQQASGDLADLLHRVFADAHPVHLPSQFPPTDSATIGLSLLNDVITRPYTFEKGDALAADEHFLFAFNPITRSYLTTRLRGFAAGVSALASTYSASGMILFIGKDKKQLHALFQHVKNGFRGIASHFSDGSHCEIQLDIMGMMSSQPVEALSHDCTQWLEAMKCNGYRFGDPFFTLLFLTAVHLPYVRLTAAGLEEIRSGQLLASALPYCE